jgi:RES domain-containing protein
VRLTAYRICPAEHADAMWTGAGSRREGGRWNSPGCAIVYAAESRSLATLELLADLDPPRKLRGYVIAGVSFGNEQVQRIERHKLPAGWDATDPPKTLQQLGDDWCARCDRVVLAVPSAVMSEEWNYLLNPAHGDFAALEKTPPTPLVLDARLR